MARTGAWTNLPLSSRLTGSGRRANPSTPELHQPLLFAPSELLACGPRDAHHHPLVGERTEDGVRSWRTSPAAAWEHPLVEWARTATSYCSLVFDCDFRESQEIACAVEAGYGDLLRPNVAAQRAASGHLHLGWNLRTPVHRGAAARPRPLAALGRIAEYYAVTLRSDRGYVGVLAYNPVHGDYNTVYPRTDPYDLGELARAASSSATQLAKARAGCGPRHGIGTQLCIDRSPGPLLLIYRKIKI